MGAAKHHHPSRIEALNGIRRAGRIAIIERERSGARGLAGDIEDILDRQRNAKERAITTDASSSVGPPRGGNRLFAVNLGEGVELPVEPVDTIEQDRGQFLR
jgi:hypothetical protein